MTQNSDVHAAQQAARAKLRQSELEDEQSTHVAEKMLMGIPILGDLHRVSHDLSRAKRDDIGKKRAFGIFWAPQSRNGAEVTSLDSDRKIQQLGYNRAGLLQIQTALEHLVVRYDILNPESQMTDELLLAGIKEVDFKHFLVQLDTSERIFRCIRRGNIEDAPEANPGAGAAGDPGHRAEEPVNEGKQERE